MQNKETFTVVLDNNEPVVVRGGDLTWREAKKRLRQYYLDKAFSLRKVTQKEYFNPSTD